ncbi:ankyrin repeat domain-containing protein, partial [Endozoicomonas sp. ONNA2]|uniref:ankyrin repeat domain-containing protein n=1 Tax=Endozoicomonas sp. ONNA2 TaxID=2828741 RepID=UPI00214735A0
NETDEEGQTPLHITAANGHGGCLERMLEINTEKVNARNNCGETALHLVARNGHAGCLRQLIENGANLHATNNNGETALDLACRKGHEAIAEVLRAAGGIKAALDRTDTVTVKVWSDSERSRRLRDLHDAARTGNTWLIGSLPGVDPSLAKEKNRFGWTALHVAACHGQTKVIQTLLANALVTERNMNGKTALDVAIRYGHTECKGLLERYRDGLLQ